MSLWGKFLAIPKMIQTHRQQPKLETEVIDDRQKAVKIQQKSFGELEPDTAFEQTLTPDQEKHGIATANVNSQFIRLECEKNRFFILKYTCETIQGILTICAEDLKESPLLDDNFYSYISADSIQVYTTKRLLHHFHDCALEETTGMSTNSIVASISQTNKFSVIVVEDSISASVVTALKNSDVRNAGVLIVGNMEDLPVIPNVFIGITQSEKIVKEADYVLERCAFGILKTVCFHLQRFESSRTLSDLEQASLKEVYDQIKAYFKECAIPAQECLDFPIQNVDYPKNIDQAIKVLMGIPFIIGCLKRSGRLLIYIQASAYDSDVERNVRHELDKYEVMEYDFLYRNVEPLCSTGDSAFGGIGTLGGFVKKVILPDASVHIPPSEPVEGAAASSANSCTLVALVARHVANASGSEDLTIGRNLRRIGRIVRLNALEAIDVLPVDVNEDCKNLCDPRFKTELNVSMTLTRLTKIEDLHNWIGTLKPVHLWGARSAPGRGTLTTGIFQTPNEDRIIIRDRRSDERFAQNRDSGAMVCYFDPRQEELYAVAMLVELMTPRGESQNREYVAEILDIALQKLSLGNGYQLVFIEDENP